MSFEHLEEKDFILFVGEGDFSFAASYLQKNGKLKNEHIFASCLSNGPLNSKQEINIKFLEQNGAFVLVDVDATSLENHPVLNRYIFSKIYFNFPHVPKKMNLRDNRKLVQLFLKSAGKILKERGRILVTLCRGQGGTDIEVVKRDWCNTWKIVSLAANAGLILCDINPFNAKDFSAYECTGYRGLSKAFDTEGAITHVFCRGQIVSCEDFQSVQNETIDSFVRALRDINKLLSKKQDSPCAKIISVLNDAIPFLSTQNIFVPELLLCRKYFSCMSSNFENSKDDLDSDRMEYCDECLSNLLSVFLKYRRSDVTTSLICSVSCFTNFHLSKPPFFHLASYFSSCEKSLMENVSSICKLLKDPYIFSQNISPISLWLDIGTKLGGITIAQQTCDIPTLNFADANISLYIHAICSIVKSDACIFYTDVDIKITGEKTLKLNNSTKYFEIGHIVKFSSNMKSYIGVLLNLDVICTLKFHIMDYRLLFLKEGYFTMQNFQGFPSPMHIFRSPSLFPPSYIHDVSFWIDENFKEKFFFMVIRNTVGYLIKSVMLIDSYYHNATKKSSRCYRFVYQSCDKVVSKQSISEIHNCLMRKTLEKSLNLQLR